MGLISYGITSDYLKDWGIPEAFREICQNFIDYGEYKHNVATIDQSVLEVIMTNDYSPKDLRFLAIGGTDKADDSSSIGGKAEGLKLALFVFLRANIDVSVRFNNTLIKPYWTYDEVLCEDVFAIEETTMDTTVSGFTVSMVLTDEEYSNCRLPLNSQDFEYSCSYGSIIRDSNSAVYIGGLYVANISGLDKSFNFKPGLVDLGRDRRIPSTWDVTYWSSQIMNCYRKSTGNWDDLTENKLENECIKVDSKVLNDRSDWVVHDTDILLKVDDKLLPEDSRLFNLAKSDKTLGAEYNKIRIGFKKQNKIHELLTDCMKNASSSNVHVSTIKYICDIAKDRNV